MAVLAENREEQINGEERRNYIGEVSRREMVSAIMVASLPKVTETSPFPARVKRANFCGCINVLLPRSVFIRFIKKKAPTFAFDVAEFLSCCSPVRTGACERIIPYHSD
jgi:hypothetical protein